MLGLALAAAGRDQEALTHLEQAHVVAVHDVPVTAALLRSVAATAGPAAALERYEDYRADLGDRLGVDPDPSLQRLHRELLVADSPVRDGVHFEADTLLGRETTSTSCGRPSVAAGSSPSSARAASARPGSRTCSPARRPSPACTSSSWSA